MAVGVAYIGGKVMIHFIDLAAVVQSNGCSGLGMNLRAVTAAG